MLNGVRLVAGRWTVLTVGARLSMGEGAEAAWTVQDLGPPVTCLSPGPGLPQDAPGPEPARHPAARRPGAEANVFFEDGRWLLESGDGTEPLVDGAMVHTSAGSWEFVQCDDLESTRESSFDPHAPKPPDVSFRFHVSQNEEHASLTVMSDGKPIALGERIHHYTLVTLARVRQQDAHKGLAPQARAG